ncbi:MAG: phosphatidate cytidylyltransferase [Chloroflexi bacterium]|nr:phosphatidate cytidylyltransferase [Chloroflexota bacterium]MDA1003825.1 phosphatidate cytidylyltransferase [Chloroflexota bacterium]
MLRQRLAVAAVGLPLLGLLLAAPEPVFAAAIEFILAVAAFELVRAAVPAADRPLALSAAAIAALFVALARTYSEFPVGWMLLVLTIVFALALRPRDALPGLRDSAAGWWILSVIYPAVLGSHFVLLRDIDDGQRWLLVLLAATFATDTGAYAVGRLFGRHLLAPVISPRKTWEGAAGGIVLGAAGAAAAAGVLGLWSHGPWLAAVAFALPPAAIAGDLIESALKRRLGVKDMSTLLPGHGGLLDRLDSLLITGPLLYWLIRWLQI